MELTPEQLRDYFEKTEAERQRLKEARKAAQRKRREERPLLSVELPKETAAKLQRLADAAGLSKSKYLGHILEELARERGITLPTSEAEKHGITLPEPATEPEPMSQVVTTTPTTSKTLQELADNWDTTE